MEYPDLKIKFQDKILAFKFLGEFNAEKDEDGDPIIFKVKGQTEENYLLNLQTVLTKSGKIEAITIIPNNLRKRLNRSQFNIKRLKDIWRMSGIYIFVSTKNSRSIRNLKYRYIGRASNKIAQRLRGYLAPGSTQTTNAYVNRRIFTSLKKDNRVLVYFFQEADTEKELQRSLQPGWNREVPLKI